MLESALAAGDIEATAARLLGRPVEAAEPAAPGGNNRVYRVRTADGALALKFYPDGDDDRRDRLGHEFQALQFLGRHRVRCVPAAVAADPGLGCAAYEWIDGEPVGTPDRDDIDAALTLAATLKALSRADDAPALPAAAEACLSAAELERQVAARLDALKRPASGHPALAAFLSDAFVPAFADFTDRARGRYREHGLDFAADIAPGQRTLSPSDFGFHNAIRRPDGDIAFVDFEYFGWDDPVRLAADFLLHPGHALDGAAAGRFAGGARELFGDDLEFAHRLEALYGLVGLRWCLIVLGEFLPARLARRRFAGRDDDARSARTRQLRKARELLDSLIAGAGRFPYGG